MKQYLLLLKSTDFTKVNNIWTSNSINLYSNSQYRNYSYTRSSSGINLLADRTFVGTEITSPGYNPSEAISPNAVYKTNYGEIVYETATPSLLRFIDTSSRIDVLSYRHIFTNVPGTVNPTFNLQVYESDEENGPWLRSAFTSDSNAIFLRNCKPFLKLQLEIFADEIDINLLGLVFYLEIGIHDTIPNTISTTAKNILRRFPSWTKLYEDSVDDATPEIATPESVGGKFLNALVQESLDSFKSKNDYQLINSFINTADIDQIAWCFVSNNIQSNINTIFGDGIQLARVSGINDFFSCRATDYVFYYNVLDRQVLTLRNFADLYINNQKIELEPINIFNDFDEFGVRVGLPRLYLESNDNYRKRILDVAANPSSSSLEGFKRTLRRELDLWRAYGSTPDSSFVGATPIVYEISDLEFSTPYVDDFGNPKKEFKTFVTELNEKYPFSIGYVNWDEIVWDTGGLEEEGLGRLNARYDYDATPKLDVYQNGVGDIGDLRFEIGSVDSSTINFSGSAHISGTFVSGTVNHFAPIIVDYNVYSSYRRQVSDYANTLANVGLVYEIDLPPHDNYATPSTFYANLNYEDNTDFIVGNRFLETNPASPEYVLFKVFDQDGLSVIQFKDKEFNSEYLNTSATPYSSQINIYDAEEIRVVFGKKWDGVAYDSLPVDDFRFTFNISTPEWISSPVEGSTISMASPGWLESSIKIGSNTYASMEESFTTKLAYSDSELKSNSGRLVLNIENDYSSVSGATINTADLINLSLLPIDAIADNIFIDVKSPGLYPIYNESISSQEVGGISFDPQANQNWLVPSSPNILWQAYDNLGNTIGSPDYFDHATINYSSTPSYIQIYSDTSSVYPFIHKIYSKFESSSTPNLFEGFIDQNNNTFKSDESYINTFFNQDQFLGMYSIEKASFGLDSNIDYEINSIRFSATPNSIEIVSLENEELLKSDLNNALNANTNLDFDVFVRKQNFGDGIYNAGLYPGWFYLNDEDYYNYSDSFTDSATGQYFEIDLTDTPRAGAPVIVEVDGVEWRNVVFEDSATPGKYSFYNTENVKANYNGFLPLAYENVSDITTTDTYTGNIVSSGKSSVESLFNPFVNDTVLNNYFTSVNGGYFTVEHNSDLNLEVLDFDIIFRMTIDPSIDTDGGLIFYKIDKQPFNINSYYFTGYSCAIQRNYNQNLFNISFGGYQIHPYIPNYSFGFNIGSGLFEISEPTTKWFRISRTSVNDPFNEVSSNSTTFKFYCAEENSEIPTVWTDLGYNSYYNDDSSSYSATPDLIHHFGYYIEDTVFYTNSEDMTFSSAINLPAEFIIENGLYDLYTFKMWNGNYQTDDLVLDIDFTNKLNGTNSFNESSVNNLLVTIDGDLNALSNTIELNNDIEYVVGRNYQVSYKVDNAYFIDKDIFNSEIDSYFSKLYLSSTPNSSSIYQVTYELSDTSKPKLIDLDVNQIAHPLDEGFVYLSMNEYDFSRIDLNLSPKYISDNNKEHMFLSIISYDENNNLKPGQTFNIVGDYIAATPEYITTNENGLGVAMLRYSGPTPAIEKVSTINIIGIGSATPNGGQNSHSEGYNREIDYTIVHKKNNRLELKAVPVRYNIDADELTNNTITGRIYWNNTPLEATINIKWAKARTLYDLFNNGETYQDELIISSRSDGSFEIVDEIVSESSIAPGYWFGSIEVADDNQIISALNGIGEVIDNDEITIVGDVVYWYEEFDNVHFSNEYTPLPNVFTDSRQLNSDLMTTPSFVYSHHNQNDIVNFGATINWLPPRWLPLRMFDQYQLGLLGATPYHVDNYSLIHPDSKED